MLVQPPFLLKKEELLLHYNAARYISVKKMYPLNKGLSKIELFQDLEKKVPT